MTNIEGYFSALLMFVVCFCILLGWVWRQIRDDKRYLAVRFVGESLVGALLLIEFSQVGEFMNLITAVLFLLLAMLNFRAYRRAPSRSHTG